MQVVLIFDQIYDIFSSSLQKQFYELLTKLLTKIKWNKLFKKKGKRYEPLQIWMLIQ